MSEPKKPKKANGAEARRTNVLLEKLTSDFRTFGEGLTAVQKRLDAIEAAVLETGRDVEWMKPVVKALAPVPDELRSQSDMLRKMTEGLAVLRYSNGTINREIEAVKTELRLVRSDVNAFGKRLEAVEARPAA